MHRKSLVLFLVVPILSSFAFSQQPAQQKHEVNVSPSVQHGPATSATADDARIKNFDFPELARAVEMMPPSADRDYFGGVLANRQGHVKESITVLEKVLPQIESSNPARGAIALNTLADDYMKLYRYADAVRVYEQLLHGFASQMDAIERKSVEDDYHVAVLLKDAPPQTIAFQAPVDVPTNRNPVLGSFDAKVTANGIGESWILDTGANLSTVSASFARKLGVSLSKDTAQTQGITGAENPLHTAILPELKIGGAVVHNVVLLVLDDANLNVPTGKTTHYQIQAILGYPVMQALERITFTHDGHFLAGPDSPTSDNGARLYMNELTPLLECGVENRSVLFSFELEPTAASSPTATTTISPPSSAV
jgi:predicted aspartyl protease